MFRLLPIYYQLTKRWLKWFWQARTRHDLHGPAAYRFAEKILEDDRQFYAFPQIETLRDWLLEDQRQIKTEDYGAGSLVNQHWKRSIADIASHTLVAPWFGECLFRVVNEYQPENILELGASLGISTAYLAAARRKIPVFTIEGNSQIYAQALRNWDWMQLDNIEAVNARFEDALPDLLARMERLDLLFLDGDHRSEASLRYFEQCLSKSHSGSIFIIADIHWSEDMETAWRQMKTHPSVRLSIDLFEAGFLFFDPAIKTKQDYCLIASRIKPWRIGMWGRV